MNKDFFKKLKTVFDEANVGFANGYVVLDGENIKFSFSPTYKESSEIDNTVSKIKILREKSEII